MKSFKTTTLLSLLIFISLCTDINASEIRGRIWHSSKSTSITDASINVTCNGKLIASRSPVNKDGTYSIRSIPSGRDCNFTVNFNEKVSAPLPVRTKKSVTVLNAEIRLLNNRLLVLPR